MMLLERRYNPARSSYRRQDTLFHMGVLPPALSFDFLLGKRPSALAHCSLHSSSWVRSLLLLYNLLSHTGILCFLSPCLSAVSLLVFLTRLFLSLFKNFLFYIEV